MVVVGFTVVDPVAAVEVNVPGVIAMEVAPEVAQLRVVSAPELMLVGLAVKLPMVGALGACTVTVVLEVTDPDALLAVSV